MTVWTFMAVAISCREEVAAREPEAGPVKRVLTSALAGRWYTDDAAELSEELDGYLDSVDAEPLANVHALILPHAGYRYSGQVAAYGVKQLAGQSFKRVVVLGPSHRLRMANRASVPSATHYATLLGEVPLDLDFIAALKRHPQFVTVPEAHDGEHSVQIEVPLLQRALGAFTLVPIVVGQLDADTARAMGGIVKGLLGPDTLVVVSSDFVHYGSRFDYVPFKDDVAENLKKLDLGAWEFIERRDVAGWYDYIDETGATICGRHAIAVLLPMLPDDSSAHLLRYDTSGHITNDWSNSVSYLSIAFRCTWERGTPMEAEKPDTATLSEDEKKQLLSLARGTLEYYVEHDRMPKPADLGVAITAGMEQVMGAFVTLHEHGRLRGCIGEIFPRRPLYEAVMDHAVNSGMRDHRFTPVVAEELPLLHYEISALTVPEPVASYEDIEIGRHGMVIEKNGRTAVFLPQVAPQQGWDIAETLTQLSRKAGLPGDAWKEGAAFTVFEAIVFEEAQ
ncbi:MAG: AmmeMemoRadiSam system protein B [Nitrospiraceae bacterium]|nr:AmmeMemoRadiSam system protein B [Nitrospiraceae bacterium]